MDVAITAVGNPPTLPTQALIDAAKAVLDAEAGFWGRLPCLFTYRAIAPSYSSSQYLGVILSDVENTIRNYIAELGPGEEYQANVLVSRIMALSNVTDLVLSPF